MSSYVKIHNEFINFISTLEVKNLTEYEKKLLNLIIRDFDSIAELGTHQGKRAKYLNNLIQKEGQEVSDKISIPNSSSESVGFPFDTLTAVEVHSFRGFVEKELIPFERQFTFLSGSNGSGKSSLCEALEYSMLGYINEAIAKRISIEDYIKNAKTNMAVVPVLSATKNGTPVDVKSNPSLYHFCFIEKNRIDNFARISANTPSEKSGLLSTLFGLDEFNNFVNEFTGNIDTYIDIKGAKNIELEQKSSKIQAHKETITGNLKELDIIALQKNAIVEKINLASTVEETEEKLKTKLKEIDKKLFQSALTQLSIHPVVIIDKQIDDLKELFAKCSKIDKEFLAKSNEVDFMELFKAAVSLEPFSKDHCPLCETPIKSSTKHPYETAKKGIDELKNIKDLQTQRKLLINKIQTLSDSFVTYTRARIEVAKRINFSKPLVDYSSFMSSPDQIIGTYSKDREAQLSLDEEIRKYNDIVKKQDLQRAIIQKDKETLVKYLQSITELRVKENSVVKFINQSDQHIKQFKDENQQLIKDATEEKKTVSTNIKYVEAYKSLINKLSAYKENLPLQQISALNQLTLELYNTINSHDKEYEQLEDIVLPVSTAGTILVSFKENHEQLYDALQILSEGHIRCLGLAILLAKNIHDNLPIIIMDDIVNAIDDDHRRGVSQMIFENKYINSKQVILTTHSLMFVKELEQYPSSKNYDKLISKLIFLPDENERRIRIKCNIIGNYLVLARKYYDDTDDKQTLYHCRCALENIATRLWNALGKTYKVDLKVVMRSPRSSPDLMTIIQSLNKLIKKESIAEYSELTNLFDYLIEIESVNNVIWEYLNKGTHDEEGLEDFDTTLVKEILEKICELDNFVKRK